MTRDIAVEAARSATDHYVNSLLGRRRAYEMLPADDPGLAVIAAATRRAFARFLASLDDLRSRGGEDEALSLICRVEDRTRAVRTPAEVTVSEES